MKNKIIVQDIVGFSFVWGAGATLAEARKQFRKIGKKFPSSKCAIYALRGNPTAIDALRISEMGLHYDAEQVTCIQVQ